MCGGNAPLKELELTDWQRQGDRSLRMFQFTLGVLPLRIT